MLFRRVRLEAEPDRFEVFIGDGEERLFFSDGDNIEEGGGIGDIVDLSGLTSPLMQRHGRVLLLLVALFLDLGLNHLTALFCMRNTGGASEEAYPV